jgi:hypothetical protein
VYPPAPQLSAACHLAARGLGDDDQVVKGAKVPLSRAVLSHEAGETFSEDSSRARAGSRPSIMRLRALGGMILKRSFGKRTMPFELLMAPWPLIEIHSYS